MPETLLAIGLVAFLAMIPTVRLLRRDPAAVGRRDATLSHHRLRLRELDRDRDNGLLAAAEHEAGRLEIQRRLLAEAEFLEAGPHADGSGSAPRRLALILTIAVVPVAAVLLYSVGGHPGLPSEPMAARLAASAASDRQDAAVIAELRTDIAALPKGSTKRREGEVLLGQSEASRGDWRSAADAFDLALADGAFDPELAVEAAEAHTRADGRVDPASAALFKRAVAAAPPDATWRTMAEERIAESEHQH